MGDGIKVGQNEDMVMIPYFKAMLRTDTYFEKSLQNW